MPVTSLESLSQALRRVERAPPWSIASFSASSQSRSASRSPSARGTYNAPVDGAITTSAPARLRYVNGAAAEAFFHQAADSKAQKKESSGGIAVTTGDTDDMVIFKGVNFYPREVETLLLGVAGGFGLSRALNSMFWNLTTADPLVMAAALTIAAGVTIAVAAVVMLRKATVRRSAIRHAHPHVA